VAEVDLLPELDGVSVFDVVGDCEGILDSVLLGDMDGNGSILDSDAEKVCITVVDADDDFDFE
jgi:hypothetical protein